MIDPQGFRSNVGIIIAHPDKRLFWGKRINQDAWQFPQGGMNKHESAEQTLFRELQEEVGLQPEQVSILGCTKHWLKYRIPKRLVRDTKPTCIGQKQKWFLLSYKGEDDQFDLNKGKKAEFDDWQWVNYWYPLTQVIAFKRDVYRRALTELAPIFWGTSRTTRRRVRPLNLLMG